jgi:hypothetical protein
MGQEAFFAVHADSTTQWCLRFETHLKLNVR